MPSWWVTKFLTLPLMLTAIGLLIKNALFCGDVIGLLHFFHSITELWTDPTFTAPALTKIVLTTALICAIGWDDLQKRREARALASQTCI